MQCRRLLTMECLKGVTVSRNWETQLADLPSIAITDSKSVYDAVSKRANTSCQVEDKRTAIDLAIVKQDVAVSQVAFRWVQTECQIADSLTKRMQPEYLREAMTASRLRIVSEEKALKAKMEERQRRVDCGEEKVLSL